jgi:hypothetical protein
VAAAASVTAGELTTPVSTPLLLRIGEVIDADLTGQEWRERARCRGMSPSFWHPPRGESLAPQRAICARCPVRSECLTFALDGGAHDSGGVWAGSSARDRRKARRYGWDARRLLAELDTGA